MLIKRISLTQKVQSSGSSLQNENGNFITKKVLYHSEEEPKLNNFFTQLNQKKN